MEILTGVRLKQMQKTSAKDFLSQNEESGCNRVTLPDASAGFEIARNISIKGNGKPTVIQKLSNQGCKSITKPKFFQNFEDEIPFHTVIGFGHV